MRQNRTRPAVLGALARGPASGYEIRRRIESSFGHFWQESLGQLYPTLSALSGEGLIRVADEGGHGDRKRVRYAITKAGREALALWLKEAPAPHVERNELLLKVFFANEGKLADALAHLESSLRDAQAQRDILLTLAKEIFPTGEPRETEALLGWLTLDYGLVGLRAHIDWCEGALRRLRARAR
ncbi:PadR family transcriptional regulator [Hyalangium versicolor]|uniref:PadR family transcriptional regulator n=1 Tax=Hyalangium versicolor TaxID=2861190 RepID=UPI001CCB9FE5|nr:PadR family transcriptional regulator [Hyalangium versicolor]